MTSPAHFFEGVLVQARAAGLLSDEHFTVDGTLLEAWASLKSFRRKDETPTPPDDPGNPTVNFHGESRRNDTHQSTTDPDAQLARKGNGREAKLSYLGHVLLDNRHGLVANVCATAATGTAERDAARLLLEASAPPGSTIGTDPLLRGESYLYDNNGNLRQVTDRKNQVTTYARTTRSIASPRPRIRTPRPRATPTTQAIA